MRIRDILRAGLFLAACLAALAGLTGTGNASPDPTRYPLCDLRVLYLYDDPAKIDWATLYYLNDQYGCRIDLATVSAGISFGATRREIPGNEMFAHTFAVVASSSSRFDSVYARLWPDRRPDIILIGDLDSTGLTSRFAAVTVALKPKAGSLFNVARIGRAEFDPAAKVITLNAQEVYNGLRDRIEREVPQLIGHEYVVAPPTRLQSRYQIESRIGRGGADFVSGLSLLRLGGTIESLVPKGGIREALSRKAGNYVSLLEIAQTQTGKPRLESVVNAYEEITALNAAARVEPSLALAAEIAPYLDELTEKVRQLAVAETGLKWDGRIVVRDSPYGPKIKFVSSMNVAGPATVMISRVSFHPYWDSTVLILDSSRQSISPHQSYVREYLIDLDSRKLESQRADSLRFSVELEAGRIPLVLSSTLPVWNAARVAVRFDPPFQFVQPFAALEVDRVVGSMALNVVVEKPLSLAATARINLETPTGVFAGAYRQDITLEKGQGMESVRIPFSISKLFELGVQNVVVSVTIDGRTIDADTGLIRIAACQVPDTVSIGLLPDTSGYLEDILRMTNARWQPLTDRTLEVGELGAYDVLLLGSGALRSLPSFRKVRARIEDFIKAGGTLVVMGQPLDWPSEMLPVSLAPVKLELAGSGISVVDGSHDLLKRPNPIATSGLSVWFERPTTVTAAVVSPTRPVLTGPGGEVLLSVSSLGRGKIVYCGLPLSDMIGTLNIEAIHLLANILNY
jgi:hypothetical protein